MTDKDTAGEVRAPRSRGYLVELILQKGVDRDGPNCHAWIGGKLCQPLLRQWWSLGKGNRIGARPRPTGRVRWRTHRWITTETVDSIDTTAGRWTVGINQRRHYAPLARPTGCVPTHRTARLGRHLSACGRLNSSRPSRHDGLRGLSGHMADNTGAYPPAVGRRLPDPVATRLNHIQLKPVAGQIQRRVFQGT